MCLSLILSRAQRHWRRRDDKCAKQLHYQQFRRWSESYPMKSLGLVARVGSVGENQGAKSVHPTCIYLYSINSFMYEWTLVYVVLCITWTQSEWAYVNTFKVNLLVCSSMQVSTISALIALWCSMVAYKDQKQVFIKTFLLARVGLKIVQKQRFRLELCVERDQTASRVPVETE